MIASNRFLWLPTSEYEERDFEYESGGYGISSNAAGVRVDAETALRCTVVLACIRVLATAVAGLPLHVYRRLPGGGKEIASKHPMYRLLHTAPNSWQTSYEWREQMMLHLLSHGDAYNEKVYDGNRLSQLVPLHPSRMTPERAENGQLRYEYRESNGKPSRYVQRGIMHVRGMSDDGVEGIDTVALAKNAIGLALACEMHGASYFANGAKPGVVLVTDGIVNDAETLRVNWERMHQGVRRAHKTAVLQGGLKPMEVGGSNMQESQFLETRRFQIEEVCRLWGVPPHLVGDLSRSSFSNIEQQSQDFLTNGLLPWLRRIESAMHRDVFDYDDEYFVKFDTRGFLRADATARSAYYNTLSNLGVASVNEIREWEDMNPVDGGDTRFVQLNMTTLDKAAANPDEAQPAAVVEEIVVEPGAPSPEPSVDDEPQVAEISLNGAQITGLIAIIQTVSDGLVTREGASAMIAASFPSIPPQQITAILAGVVERQPEPAAVEAQPPQEPGAAPTPASEQTRAVPEQDDEAKE